MEKGMANQGPKKNRTFPKKKWGVILKEQSPQGPTRNVRNSWPGKPPNLKESTPRKLTTPVPKGTQEWAWNPNWFN